MHDTHDLMTQLDAVFHPQSVAIVGVPRGMKMGKLFLISLLELGFAGDIYPVHPEADEIDGIKAYPNVSAIPGPVDQPVCQGLPDNDFITTEYEYDANRNQTLVRNGEATEGRQPDNVVQFLYDERDLLFQTIRAPGSADQSTGQTDYDGNGKKDRAGRG